MLTVIIPRRPKMTASDLADASAKYSEVRDASGEGASTFYDGVVMQDGKPVARISYNGRIWPLEDWTPDMTPLFDNRVSA